MTIPSASVPFPGATPRLFPIMPYGRQWVREKPERDKGPHPNRIPWSVAELAYSVYSRGGCSQSLETLASRGGFGAAEMDRYVPDWRERCSEITALRTERDALKAEVQRWAEAALVGLSGIVCTPEAGYLKDGGVGQFRADMESLRKLVVSLEASNKRLRDAAENVLNGVTDEALTELAAVLS